MAILNIRFSAFPYTQGRNIALWEAANADFDSNYVLIEKETETINLDIRHPYRVGPFKELLHFGDWIAIGLNDRLYLFNLLTEQFTLHLLSGYFGSMRITDGRLFVCSAADILSFDASGLLCWVSDQLGMDGVIISNIEYNRINGEGDWNPPGGWEPFSVVYQ
jgi:hypothetical protein